MRDWSVSVDNGSFDSAGITNDCQDAICEYIWNGFEAEATKVFVSIIGGNMQEAPEIHISDNGTGINHASLHSTFGAFLSSQKKSLRVRLKSATNKGKGRFSYTAISSSAVWDTVYADETGLHKYAIQLDSANKVNVRESDITDVSVDEHKTGTTVRIPLTSARTEGLLAYEKMRTKLLQEFAWYLCLNRDKGAELCYLGNRIDYSDYIDGDLSQRVTVKIEGHDFIIDVIVWKSRIKNSSKIYYINDDGIVTESENTRFNKNTVDFHHGVFVQSSYFTEIPTLTGAEDESIVEFADNQKQTMRALKKQIHVLLNDTLHQFLLVRADKYIDDLDSKALLPDFGSNDLGQCRKRDFVNVTREIYCAEPKIFYQLKPQQSKSLLGFLALLLDSSERENILSVIEQAVALTPEQREKFARILRRTKLEHIIDVIDVIQKRYEIVNELRKIVYDPTMSRFANERDHIQKVVEQHFWLFGDQYSMITADVTFRRSLEKFETHLGLSSDEASVLSPEELRQRMDIFLYGGRMNEAGIKEGLVIELKAPSVILSQTVLSQIERYAAMIRREPQFSGNNRVWRFYAICSTVDEDVAAKYDGYKSHGKFRLASVVGNFEIYALTWDDIFLSFEQRHRFLLEKMQADFEESVELGSPVTIDRQYINDRVKKLVDIQLVNPSV